MASVGFPKKANCTKKNDFFYFFLYIVRRFNVQIQCTCTKSVNKKKYKALFVQKVSANRK